jgi:hypothetical protein
MTPAVRVNQVRLRRGCLNAHDLKVAGGPKPVPVQRRPDRMKPRRLVPQLAISVFHLIGENEIVLVRVIQS